ncbi:hypothetical protein S83_055620 [Arachis hypogaea]
MCDLLFSLRVPCHCLRFTLLYSISSPLPMFLIIGVAVGVSVMFVAARLAVGFVPARVAICSSLLAFEASDFLSSRFQFSCRLPIFGTIDFGLLIQNLVFMIIEEHNDRDP